MNQKHSQEEIEGMLQLIEDSLKYLCRYNGDFFNKNIDEAVGNLMKKYKVKIVEILNKPHGGTLAPEEIAEIILTQEVYKRHIERRYSEEAAATSTAYQ